MASILISFGTEEEANTVAKAVIGRLGSVVTKPAKREDDLDEMMADRGGVVGPLRDVQTGVFTVLVWVHDAVTVHFLEEMQRLFNSDEVCSSFRDAVSGLQSS